MSPAEMKYRFSHAERYAVWLHHEKRCWQCLEPLRLVETSIDHFVPENVAATPQELNTIIREYGLPPTFNVNGFENWLPCHRHCNEARSKTFELHPGNVVIFIKLFVKAPAVQRTAISIKQNVEKDKLFAKLFVAMEEGTISFSELQAFVGDLCDGAFVQPAVLEPRMIRLDNGYWLREEDIVAEGPCTCGQPACVDSDSTVYCYWSNLLSPWVIDKRLYWRCYDEIIDCPSCNQKHKRGHVGRPSVCAAATVEPNTQVT